MLLAIDIGNTDIVFGLFDAETLSHQWRVPVQEYTLTQQVTEEYRQAHELNFSQVEKIILSSVVAGGKPGEN